jgi:hypothetical protein
VIPLPLKPEPEGVIDEIVRFALPVLLSEIDCVPLLPTVTFPKLTVVGLVVSCAVGAGAPVPVIETEIGLLAALLTKDTWPEALPATVGANFAL